MPAICSLTDNQAGSGPKKPEPASNNIFRTERKGNTMPDETTGNQSEKQKPAQETEVAKTPVESASEPPVAGGAADDLYCQCCDPPQPLVPPADGSHLYTCPVNADVQYTYDAATGIVTRVNPPAARRGRTPEPGPAGSATPSGRTSLFPSAPPKHEVRTVNPEDPYAA